MAKPDYRVSTPVETGEADAKKTYWTNIGSGWKTKDDSISVSLNALPVNGKLVLFVPKEEEQPRQKRF